MVNMSEKRIPNTEVNNKTRTETPGAGHDSEPNTIRHADDALALVGEHAQEIDPVIAQRVVRKTDMFLIPVMFMVVSVAHWQSIKQFQMR